MHLTAMTCSAQEAGLPQDIEGSPSSYYPDDPPSRVQQVWSS